MRTFAAMSDSEQHQSAIIYLFMNPQWIVFLDLE